MEIINFFLHLETHMAALIHQFGPYVYALLFTVIFAETGFVVTPFLPGDSLLFVVGTLAGNGYLNIWLAYVLMLIAAIAGNTLNYWLGYKIGHKVFAKENSRIFNKKYLERTREFFENYGGKTIILTRFMPILRSFAPFVAGMGSMEYKTFQIYNVIGGFLWVTLLIFAGYFFGGLDIVKKHFEIAVFGIIIVSIAPAIFEYFKEKGRHKKRKEKEANYKDIKETFKEEDLKQ